VARPTTGWHGLTESERRVVDLVQLGHTNRQIAAQMFISPHTVDSHLRHVFAKLGVSSRVQVAALAGGDGTWPTAGR